MVMVKLRETKRYFEDDDTSFYIQNKQELELPEKHLRSYSIKHALFHGNLLITEGEFLLQFKAAVMYVAKDVLYCKEYGKYFMKDLEMDTITYISDDEVPKNILAKLNGEENEPEGQAESIKEEVKSEVEEPETQEDDGEAETETTKEDVVEEIKFEEMTKKQLKAYIKENKLEIGAKDKGGMVEELNAL